MILFTLRCSGDHAFEAWFSDGAAYEEQASAGAIACPVCGDREIGKAPMAPRIAKGGGGEESGAAKADGKYTNAVTPDMRGMLRALRRHVEANSDYVGETFADEARKIHYGETEERNIHGEATDAEAEALKDEGIEVGKIPWLPLTDS